MDDRSRTTNVGTIAKALAVRDGKILKLGEDQQILALAGPNTQRIDVKGRTVLPGLIDTHSHVHEGADHWGLSGLPRPIVVQGETNEELNTNLGSALKKAVAQTASGEWIRMSVAGNLAFDLLGRGKLLSRRDLDSLAPNNPVHIAVRTMALVNLEAIEAVEQFYRSSLVDEALDRETGVATFGTEFNRAIPIMLLHSRPDIILENVRRELEEWTSFGITTFSSHINVPGHVNAYAELNRKGLMAIRFAWTHRSGTLFNSDAGSFYTRVGDLAGSGSDYWWNIGVTVGHLDQSYPAVATTIQAKPEIKEREINLGEAGDFKHGVMFDMVRSGLRITGTHIAGDLALDNFMDIIEEGSKAAGMTAEQIRQKAHVVDHCTLGPRPEQYDRIKRLGITMSCAPKYIPTVTPRVLKEYGENYTGWVVPLKSLNDSGVKFVWEIDEHPQVTAFEYLELPVTRESEDNMPWAPAERVDRVTALKAATSWASEYVLRPQVLGTLEPGKWADLIVLNNDFFSVPAREISEVRSLLTMVGGKISFLDSALASELGRQPVGYQRPPQSR
ncbi:MAG: amidohydrolase family protein [Acidobacteria bacterium]|nr:amidohydrolase family protein [Acidobacteriota bacterium]